MMNGFMYSTWLINPYTAIPHKYLCGNIPDWQCANHISTYVVFFD